jgi:hypothetical protein
LFFCPDLLVFSFRFAWFFFIQICLFFHPDFLVFSSRFACVFVQICLFCSSRFVCFIHPDLLVFFIQICLFFSSKFACFFHPNLLVFLSRLTCFYKEIDIHVLTFHLSMINNGKKYLHVKFHHFCHNIFYNQREIT